MIEASSSLGRTIAACGIAFTVMSGAALFAQGTIPAALAASNEPPAAVQVDLNQVVGPYKPIYRWFGYDEANYTTMPEGRELLRQLL